MKLILTSVVAILISINCVFGQSIPSHWMNRYDLESFYKTKESNVEEIEVKKVGYYSNGKSYKSKWKYNFTEPQKCTGIFFKENQIKSHFVYEFDSLFQLIKITSKTKVPLINWERTVRVFEYQGTKRMTENHYRDSTLVRSAIYQYDSIGYLVSLFTNEGYETAGYNHQDQSYAYKIFKANGDLVLEETKFANWKVDQSIKNNNGDFIQVIWPSANPKDHVFHKFEYKYDKNGNWIERKRYIVKNGKKTISSKIKRTIKYKG